MPFTNHPLALPYKEPDMKIRTTHVYPPIPVRSFDWSAVDDDTYDADCDQDGFFSTSPIGWGATEAEAIADLKEQRRTRDENL
jgi:hypothetical protein